MSSVSVNVDWRGISNKGDTKDKCASVNSVHRAGTVCVSHGQHMFEMVGDDFSRGHSEEDVAMWVDVAES